MEMLAYVVAGAVAAVLVIVVVAFERVEIMEYERGLLYRRGRYVELLGPGRYLLVRPVLGEQVVKMDTRRVSVAVPAQETLARSCADAEDPALCERSAAAGYGMLRVFETDRNGESEISFEKRETMTAWGIVNIHAGFQCRLDTFLHGAADAARPACWYNPQ